MNETEQSRPVTKGPAEWEKAQLETEQSRPVTKGPAEWEPEQLETDDGTTEPAPSGTDTTPDRARWNKGSMGEENADHTRSPLAGDEELGESGGPLSGGGANPGGGERFADREKS